MSVTLRQVGAAVATIAVFAWLGALATVLGTMAVLSGASMPLAILVAAGGAFFATWFPLVIAADILVRLRGGPFVPGVRVRIRSGEHADARGIVVRAEPDSTHVGVDLDVGGTIAVTRFDLERDRTHSSGDRAPSTKAPPAR